MKIKSKKSKQTLRHNPLHVQMLADETLEKPERPNIAVKGGKNRGKPKNPEPTTTQKHDDDDEAEDTKETSFVDTKTSKKILNLIKEQQSEESEQTSSFRQSYVLRLFGD
ncbi:hypothetical protein HDU96_004742 [Phlyctochytrium bullatum]|nr:hypothetical protein HDU96_004742 [Phlyctochytrium bullatum]